MTKNVLKLIANPYAGRWKVKARLDAVKAELRRLNLAFDLSLTSQPGDGVALAKQAVSEGYQTLVAVGGDGTVSEVVNGMMQASKEKQVGTLGVLPLGTANDLAENMDIPTDLATACKRLTRAETRIIDVCQVNERFFVNNSAVGLEAVVTQSAARMERFKDPLRYLWAATSNIWSRPAWKAYLVWDNKSFRGPIVLVSVGNGPKTGGSFYMTPRALLDDGLFDFVFAPSMRRYQLLALLPQTLFGRHINNDRVVHIRTNKLSIVMEPTPLQVDGELVDLAATHLEYRVLPQKLRVIV